MIYIVAGTKGGIGKSLISWHALPAIFALKGKKFKIFEVDDTNQSNIFSESEIIKDNAITVRTDKDDLVSVLQLEALKNPDTNIIVDAGGGNDTLRVVEILKNVLAPKKWILPITRSLRQISNAKQTNDLIGKTEEIIFALNGYERDKKKDFIFWHGSKEDGIPKMKFSDAPEIFIPYSIYFEMAEQLSQTIWDYSIMAQNFTPEKATQYIFEKCQDENGDVDDAKFIQMHTGYQQSVKALKVIEQLNENTKVLG